MLLKVRVDLVFLIFKMCYLCYVYELSGWVIFLRRNRNLVYSLVYLKELRWRNRLEREDDVVSGKCILRCWFRIKGKEVLVLLSLNNW